MPLVQRKLKKNKLKDGGHCPGNQGNQESEEELEQGKAREFKQLSKSKSLIIPQIQSDDLSFYTRIRMLN